MPTNQKQPLELSINGEIYELAVACQETLLEVLRNRLGLTGTKEGCGTGECGLCTVLLEGEPVLACLLLAVDCGFPINPLLVEGQIDGQISMALGHAFLEEVMMEEGRTLNLSWLDYRMPSIREVADSEHLDVITEQYRIGKPYRTKEVGEGYVSAILAATANANTMRLV